MLNASAKTLAKMIMARKSELKFAVGSGIGTWDNFTPPAFEQTRSTLYAESFRTDVTSVEYIDPTTYAVSATPTNALKIVGKVPSTSSIDNSYIREKAVFLTGATKDSGDLLHAETTALETKVVGKEHETILYLIIR